MPTAGVVGNVLASPSTAEYWVGRYGNYQPHGHAGWDGEAPVGSNVYAMAGGKVLWADWGYRLPGSGPVRKWLFYSTFPGKLLVIQHWWGLGAYAHLSEFKVRAGDTVTEGQVVALSGNTGGVDPHLHVEALVDLSYRTAGGLIYGRTDPTKYFGTIAPAGETTTEDEENDMFNDQDRIKLDATLDHAFRARQVAEAIESSGVRANVGLLLRLMTAMDRSFRFIKGPGPGNDTLFDVGNGDIRGITLAEWQALGSPEPVEVDQSIIDDLLAQVAARATAPAQTVEVAE